MNDLKPYTREEADALGLIVSASRIRATVAALDETREVLRELFEAEMEKCMLRDGKADQIEALDRARAVLAEACCDS